MGRRTVITILLLGSVVGLPLLVWWLFGWSSIDNPALGHMEFNRSFGRVTKATIDTDRDGSIDGEWLFDWSEPYSNEHLGGIQPYRLLREDRNHDGQWDTWWEPVDEPGGATRLSADTTGDGVPDWHRDVDDESSSAALSALESQRGF